MADELSAIHMVNYYNSGFPCVVKNKQCFVQHSTHKELRTDQYHANQVINLSEMVSESKNHTGSRYGKSVFVCCFVVISTDTDKKY